MSDLGFEVLAESVRLARRLYKDRFDYLVCHNQLDDAMLAAVSSLGVDLRAQRPGDFHLPPHYWDKSVPLSPDVPSQPARACWKLYPPRLRLGAHEIVVDNDVVLLEPIPQVEEFLSRTDRTLMTEAMGRNYGVFEKKIPALLKLNSGFYGMPPGYDFARRVRYFSRLMPGGWRTFFDEQGIIAAGLLALPLVVIPREELDFADALFTKNPRRKGYHFVSINVSEESPAWAAFRRGRMIL